MIAEVLQLLVKLSLVTHRLQPSLTRPLPCAGTHSRFRPHLRARVYFSNTSVQFSSVQSLSRVRLFATHELQHARPPCPSPTPGVHSNSHPSSRWCHPAISSSVNPFSSCPQSLPASVFSNELTLGMRWPKYWRFSFSISPSKEHPGLISFRMD